MRPVHGEGQADGGCELSFNGKDHETQSASPGLNPGSANSNCTTLATEFHQA